MHAILVYPYGMQCFCMRGAGGVDMVCFFSPSTAEERRKIPKEERGKQCWLA